MNMVISFAEEKGSFNESSSTYVKLISNAA